MCAVGKTSTCMSESLCTVGKTGTCMSDSLCAVYCYIIVIDLLDSVDIHILHVLSYEDISELGTCSTVTVVFLMRGKCHH